MANVAAIAKFRTVPMPAGLSTEHLRTAMDETTKTIALINECLVKAAGKPLTAYIQSNSFSGIISNMLTNEMDKCSPYKHNHDQRYPDLKNAEGIGLEMKAANKPSKGGESHNGHSGWHLIACFDLDEKTGDITFSQIEIAELIGHQQEPEGDWHYCGSKVNDKGSRRTETYYTTNRGTTKLRDGSAYLDHARVKVKGWQRDKALPIPPHSPQYVPTLM